MQITLAPELLTWARERARLEQDELARKLQVKVERVRDWEQSGQLSLKQAERLARKTYVPFGYLFLRQPPEEELPVEDFRTLRNGRQRRPGPDLLEVIYDAQIQQDWYGDYLIEQGAEPLGFVGSATSQDEPTALVTRIGREFRWSSADRAKAGNREKALALGVQRAADCGIIVQRRGYVGNNTARALKVEEFRGFALVDRYAPFVLINAADAKSAQMFTLVHEVVHIWLGVSAVSNADPAGHDAHGMPNDVEAFCDRVAAEYLVPRDELHAGWRDARSAGDYLQPLVRRFTVSGIVILRRLRDLQLISQDEFFKRCEEETERFRRQAEQRGGGGSFYATRTAQLSMPVARAILESSLEGRTPYGEALKLLGLRNTEMLRKYATGLTAEDYGGGATSYTVTSPVRWIGRR